MKRAACALLARLGHALGTLRARLTLAGIALLMLVVFANTALLVQRADRALLAEERERELGETVRTAAVLASQVQELQGALRAVAEQLDEATLRDQAALERFMLDEVVLRRMFGNISAVTPDGRVRAYAERQGLRAVSFSVADRAYFREALVEGRPSISEPVTSRAVGEPSVVLAQPLRGPRGVYGVLSGTLRLGSQGLLAQVLQYRGPGEIDALLVVTDLQGRILAHPDRGRLLQPLATEPRLADAWVDWVRIGAPLESAGVTVQQPGELVAVAAVAGPQWLVWRTLPQRQLLAPLHEARRQALAWAAAMVLGASLVLMALVTLLLRPMRALQRRAQQLSDPAIDPLHGWPRAGGEIGALARVLRQAGAERARLEGANAELLQRLGSVMEAAPVGIAFSRESRFELVNPELCRLLGLQPPAPGSVLPLDVLGLEDTVLQALLRQVHRAFADQVPYRGEWQLRDARGRAFWAQLGVRPARAEEPARGLIWTVSDVSAQRAAHARLQWAAHHDALTGLANRAAFEVQVHKVFAALPHSVPAVLVAIDLDHFKPINDSAGHAAGDAMLKAVATAIRGCVRAGDLVARLGGDEFVLLLERCTAERALPIADAVCAAVAAIELPWDGRVLRLGASAGVAALREDMTEAAHWLRAADRACYDAKAAGRGRVHAAGPGSEAAVVQE
ncbi:sensor domain-containing diguanylate cyclase [Azohydromonas aeria]|uniref:sensor domain-containing diguanylate cyclase n=1 Tax=Azohydromonas aeria TaxID=2590212 RepID=UPI0012F78784|nr:diguanylate cyclase [Azohydromonas aeria]